MNVIPCTTWVKQGVAAAVPEKVQLTPKELEEIIKQTHSDLQNPDTDSDEEEDNAGTSGREPAVQNNINQSDEFDFDKYDEEPDNIHCTIRNIATFGEDGRDPLITVGDSDDSEKEDDIIKSDDNLVLIGHVDGDASILEVFVYNESEGSFYCHHDILLPSFPLCIEWLNFDPSDSKPGNLCAIGSMSPIIEVWDLDLMDCLEPAFKLGCKPNKKKKQKRVGHKNAVLDIAWNQNYSHVLASGSVDQTTLLWDLENGTPVTKLDQFEEKVQSLKWHPTETHQLLTGSADKTVKLFDCKHENMARSWTMPGEVEKVLWNHYNTNYCLASTDNGYIHYFDIREDVPVWQIQPHEKEVTGLTLSSWCEGLLVSSSNDGVIKAWDIVNNTAPELIWETKSNLGALQCLAANPDNPFVFAVGGDNKANNFKVLDFREIPEIHGRFKDRNVSLKHSKKEETMEIVEGMECT